MMAKEEMEEEEEEEEEVMVWLKLLKAHRMRR